MSRSLPEWIGATDDTPVPDRVKLRVLLRYDSRCRKCTRELNDRNQWDIDHIVPLSMGRPGDPTLNREDNLQPLCRVPCHSGKTRTDSAEKAAIYKIRKKAAGIRKKVGRPMPGSRRSGIRKRMDGRVEQW